MTRFFAILSASSFVAAFVFVVGAISESSTPMTISAIAAFVIGLMTKHLYFERTGEEYFDAFEDEMNSRHEM